MRATLYSLWLAIAAAFVGSSVLHSQVPLLGAGSTKTVGAPVGYQGPIDVAGVSAKGAWGLRCLSAAYCGGNLANVCTDIVGVDTCLDFSSNAATGNLVIVTIGGLSCAAVVCTVKTLYDQSGAGACSGACPATQATVSTRPTLIVSCIGASTLPCMRTGASSLVTPSLGSTLSQPNWVSAVADRTTNFTTTGSWLGDGGNNEATGSNNTVNTVLLYAGSSFTATASDSAPHAVQTIANGASSEIYVDGSNSTGNAGAGALSGVINLLKDGFGNNFAGDITEIILWNAAPSSGQKSAVDGNQHTYWSF